MKERSTGWPVVTNIKVVWDRKRREGEKTGARNDAKRDWTQRKIGGSGRWSKIASVEKRRARETDETHRHKMRKESKRNCHRH